MNIGNVFFELVQALMNFGGNLTEFLGARINISGLLRTLQLIGIDTTSIPTDITALGLIGSLGGVALLMFFVIKLIRG